MNIGVPQEIHLNSTNTAVIVIDKQFGYFVRNESKDGTTKHLTASLPNIDKFIATMRKLPVEIIWTKMVENRQESPPNIKIKINSDPGNSDRTQTSKKSFDFIGSLPKENEKCITKYYYDAFAATDLEKVLKDKGIKNIILVGGYGSRCVLATAFGANGRGFNVIVGSDLVSNPDKFIGELDTAINIIDSILGWSIDSKNLINLLQNSAAR